VVCDWIFAALNFGIYEDTGLLAAGVLASALLITRNMLREYTSLEGSLLRAPIKPAKQLQLSTTCNQALTGRPGARSNAPGSICTHLC
jgi:hypothetical protein